MQDDIDRLPATERAQLTWAVPRVRAAVDAYLDSDLGGDAERALTTALWRILADVRGVAVTDRGGRHDAALRETLAAEAVAMRDRLAGATADSAEWALRTWAALTAMPIADAGRGDAVPQPSGEGGRAVDAWVVDADSPLRLQALLLALSESVARGRSAAVVDAVADSAYDVAQAVLRSFRAQGVDIDPFAGESTSDRAARLKRYLQNMRAVLTDEDVRVIEDSRLLALR